MKQTLKWFYETHCEKNISLSSFYKEIKIIMADPRFGEYKYKVLTHKQLELLLDEYPWIKIR